MLSMFKDGREIDDRQTGKKTDRQTQLDDIEGDRETQ